MAVVTFALGAPAVATTDAGARAFAPRCSPCTYVVTPNGTGAHDVRNVLANLVQPSDSVLLADGVYRVANLQVNASGVTIRAQHVPGDGETPSAWLDGSIPYLIWTKSGSNWSHAYSKDF